MPGKSSGNKDLTVLVPSVIVLVKNPVEKLAKNLIKHLVKECKIIFSNLSKFLFQFFLWPSDFMILDMEIRFLVKNYIFICISNF